ncbi:MAG: hypothetical protein P4M00_05905 [Azospirillaceae bacterium]|nr:hypothetical protein [Azospirillaceae bacterium]
MNNGKGGNGTGPASWIEDGEKYAFIGLSATTDSIASCQVSPNLWAVSGVGFKIPKYWQQWLGSIRSGEVEECNLFLLAKKPTDKPELLDDENNELKNAVYQFYVGLLLASTFAPAHKPIMLTGARRDGETDIRQQQDMESPVPCQFRPHPPILASDIRLAAKLGDNVSALAKSPLVGGHWRLFRTLSLYVETRTVGEILDRLHQYCRCIDGLILPDTGRTGSQFKSRTELFVGPRLHSLFGDMYKIRSAVEHLHENRYLESFDRNIRLEIMRKEAILEHVARTAITKIIGDAKLWPHFANTTALAAFWKLDPTERQRIWGDPIDPMVAIAELGPQFIDDGHLGAP